MQAAPDTDFSLVKQRKGWNRLHGKGWQFIYKVNRSEFSLYAMNTGKFMCLAVAGYT